MVKINSGFSSILVCVDNSKQSQKALSRAISVAEKIWFKTKYVDGNGRIPSWLLEWYWV